MFRVALRARPVFRSSIARRPPTPTPAFSVVRKGFATTAVRRASGGDHSEESFEEFSQRYVPSLSSRGRQTGGKVRVEELVGSQWMG
jgi:hypothetical protein